jgi:hypothetical protein
MEIPMISTIGLWTYLMNPSEPLRSHMRAGPQKRDSVIYGSR